MVDPNGDKAVSGRRKAREATLQALFWVESSEDPFDQAVSRVSEMARLKDSSRVFAVRLGKEVLARREGLDEVIASVSEHWDIERLARVDRTILRMALTEMLRFEDIPVKVSIDEAIELGRCFGGEESPRFINGILDAIIKRHGIVKGRPVPL